MVEEVDIIAAGMVDCGIKSGSRFATVLPNFLEHCLIILALARLGTVPALVNTHLTATEGAQLVEDGAIILPDPEFAQAVAAVLPEGAPLLSVGIG